MANEIMTIRGMDKDIYLTNRSQKEDTFNVLGFHKSATQYDSVTNAINTRAKIWLKSGAIIMYLEAFQYFPKMSLICLFETLFGYRF